MIVYPQNTAVTFYKAIPMPADYSSTFYPRDTGVLQGIRQFFANWRDKITIENLSYQRATRRLRVTWSTGDFMSYNYLSFQNPDSGLIYYCFIDDVAYINNQCYEFTFHVDELMTFLPFVDIHSCLVEREHVENDTKGYHTLPEDFSGVGQMDYECLMSPFEGDAKVPGYPEEIAGFTNSKMMIVILATFDNSVEWLSGVPFDSYNERGINNSIFSGLNTFGFNMENYERARRFLDLAVQNNAETGVIAIYMCPQAAITQEIGGAIRGYDFSLKANDSDFAGYAPKNNKLFTYPYNMLYVTNNEGNAANYKFEYFSKYEQSFGAVDFSMVSQFVGNPVVGMFPRNYAGTLYSYNDILTTSSYPTCSWQSNVFQAYLAQNTGKLVAGAVNLGLGAVSSAASVAIGGVSAIATGGALGGNELSSGITGLTSAASQAISSIGNLYDISTLPPQAHGNDTSTLNQTMQVKGFEVYRCFVNSETAKMIDDYFSQFGYKVNRLKVPNLTSRPNWNYIKTIGADFTGQAPASVLAHINAIFNNGITLWHHANTYNDYSQDNRAPSGN